MVDGVNEGLMVFGMKAGQRDVGAVSQGGAAAAA